MAVLGVALLIINVRLVVDGVHNSSSGVPSKWEWSFLLLPIAGPVAAAFRARRYRRFGNEDWWWWIPAVTLFSIELLVFAYLFIGFASSITL
jgi:hypothetical protein